ncbi:MAG: L,D-transpeptidase family protein [Mailhella sp.]|nr:L,D-transpeptidase family protein [Mailhella sp.]
MHRLLCLALITLLLPVQALADDWSACVAQPAPKFFYVADKARKLLFQMEEKDGATAIARKFECIHGRVEGDKQKEGDLKTPEGVYFITKVITQKLDFMEYGPYAVALNYPNPADRLRGKTGGGIWLHSKGQAITGITTRGCLAIDRHEIMEIAPLLKPGTPVIVAEKTAGAPFYDRNGNTLPACGTAPCDKKTEPAQSKEQAEALPVSKTEVSGKLQTGDSKTGETAAPSACVHAVDFPVEPTPAFCAVQTADAPRLRELTLRWMDLREQHSKELFALYDDKAWPRSSRENFSQKKGRLLAGFKAQNELQHDRAQINVLYGPGYWVTCFPESYKLGEKLCRNLRALYWMKNASGEYRLIGETLIRK